MPKIIKPVSKDSFTSATISVDGQGRIFSAAAGSAGAQGYQLTEFRQGSDSFTYSAVDTNATKGAGVISGGGGGGGRSNQGGGASPHTPDSPRPSAGSTNTPNVFNYSTSDFSPSTTNIAPPAAGSGGNSSNGPNATTSRFTVGGQGGSTSGGSGSGGPGYIYIFEQVT